MSMRQLWEGSDNDNWLQPIDGRTKLFLLFVYAILVMTIDNPRTLFIVFTSALAWHFSVKTSFYKWQVLAVLLVLSLWGSMFSQGLFFAQSPRTPLLILVSPDNPWLGNLTGGLCFYREGILYGALQGLRSATMLTMGLLVCWTSDPRQLLKAFVAWSLSPRVAFMLVTALRFLPTLAAEAGEVLTALQLRSTTLAGRKGTVRHLWHLANPLLARCLRRSQTLALSVVSRGFFMQTKQNIVPWPQKERMICWALGLIVAIVVSSKIAYELAQQGLYFGELRYIYDWTKLYI